MIDPCDLDDVSDGIPDECDIDTTEPDAMPTEDDSCQTDSDQDGIIDPCDPDDDGDGIPDECDIDTTGARIDANGEDDHADGHRRRRGDRPLRSR